MIDLTRLYEIAPQLAPRNYRNTSGKVKKIPPSDAPVLENPLRLKLLRNLVSFREHKESGYCTQTYTCSSRNSSSFLNSTLTSLNSSANSQRMMQFPLPINSTHSRKVFKTQKLEKEMRSSFESEKKSYIIDITSTLKSTIPTHLQSTRRKLLKNLTK